MMNIMAKKVNKFHDYFMCARIWSPSNRKCADFFFSFLCYFWFYHINILDAFECVVDGRNRNEWTLLPFAFINIRYLMCLIAICVLICGINYSIFFAKAKQ